MNYSALVLLPLLIVTTAFADEESLKSKQFATHAIQEIFMKRNVDAIDLYVSDDYTQNQPGLPHGKGPFKDYLRKLFIAFPDYSGKIENVVAEGDLVSFHISWSGTHQGPFLGVKPTGKRVSRRTADVLRVKDGKLVEHWGIVDQLDLLKELGLLRPATQQAPE